jgi:hypothetical protein
MRRVGIGRRPGGTRRIAVARLVGLSDAGEGLPIASLGEPAQQLRVELASSARAVMVDVDIDTSLGRPLEGSQARQRLPIRKTDDMVISLEDKPFVGWREAHRCAQPCRQRSGRRFPN